MEFCLLHARAILRAGGGCENYTLHDGHLDRNDLLIPSEKNSELSEMVDVLRPFEVVTREMSGEKYVCSSKIIPLAKALQ